ncbi:TetR/AcrR family transcriptional regulator [bacterium]|nr:TetR/AcrR family transcriptional regulator [bacterium]
MRQREKDRIRNKDLFLKSAEVLFEEKGYFNTSMEEIADKAGFSKGTIYNYFDGKDHLLVESVDVVFSNLNSSIDEIFPASKSLSEGIKKYIHLSFEILENKRNFYLAMMSEAFKQECLPKEQIHRKVFEGMGVFLEKLKMHIEQFEDELNPKISSNDLALMIISITTGSVGQWIAAGGEFNLLDKEKVIFELILNGSLKKM